ncbi:hypothetical protein VTN96DRAFT_6870 [Rasamsonia emersonii]|uniref:rRNA-processing protein FYV7 n=1 Tax=Rasamsonia emersonii (strain ATCC 16479 / CBS 393.64 / IMI 116815) TaxID=1408163 RepID=A0A0F4Z0A4_RASE3|nr:hypothetical protein T310_2652 [Rasamsonia emersonii CBS 393.64]KKA23293.1 hypothetical protein T310_2652 [Rasamsonia emersonii CBS 393.64]
MAPKRPRDGDDAHETKSSEPPAKKQKKKGFQVGPANLPDGTYRRKVQKIKRDLIHKAKVKKVYAKIKAQELANAPARPSYYSYVEQNSDSKENNDSSSNNDNHHEEKEPASMEMHPERQAMLNTLSQEPRQKATKDNPNDNNNNSNNDQGRERRKRRQKPSAFAKEMAIAEKKRQEREARRKEKELKAKEREAMARAKRPDRFGRKHLSRESKVLLSKVQRMVGQA